MDICPAGALERLEGGFFLRVFISYLVGMGGGQPLAEEQGG